MHIDLVFSPLEVSRIQNIENKTVIVIDVLRASSTMIYAFNGFDNDELTVLKGVREIIPARDVEAAVMLYNSNKDENILLGGEKEGYPPQGFHLGNSPFDYTVEAVQGKTLIMATTNGTKTLNLVRDAKHVLIGAFVNAFAVARKAIELKHDVVIACAGREDISGLEDITCGGLIAGYIIDLGKERPVRVEVSDSILIASRTYKSFKSVLDILQTSNHGHYLHKKGFEKDLYPCSLKNRFQIVPKFINNAIYPEVLEKVTFCSLYD